MKTLTAKQYLESKGLNDHDYMDSGMINHISEMMEEYHQAKLLPDYIIDDGQHCLINKELSIFIQDESLKAASDMYGRAISILIQKKMKL